MAGTVSKNCGFTSFKLIGKFFNKFIFPPRASVKHKSKRLIRAIYKPTVCANEWSNGKIKFEPENFDCVGCTEDGEHYSWCDMCPVRKCNTDKKIKNCAYCIHYPCEELDEPFERLPNSKKNLDKIRKNL